MQVEGFAKRTDPPDDGIGRPRGGLALAMGAHIRAAQQRDRAPQPPWLQKCTDGPDQNMSFLRPTESFSASALPGITLADKTLGRGSTAVVGCCPVISNHTREG